MSRSEHLPTDLPFGGGFGLRLSEALLHVLDLVPVEAVQQGLIEQGADNHSDYGHGYGTPAKRSGRHHGQTVNSSPPWYRHSRND